MISLKIKTDKRIELINLTSRINSYINFKEGLVNIFVKHTTAALWINENDEGIKEDLNKKIEKLISSKEEYLHNKLNNDDNGDAHLRTTLFRTNELVPIKNNKLDLGRWQNIFLVELSGPREREIILNFIEQ
ncbi:MAG: secondary thiamine-phosphate synthase enzyme YjbQ [Candidatus Nanoarchaeia archaeon]|nr:secondary thiamine-phosphate synthase enzyme YjbQ [Candidatus Nanoarchaeia archaeon]